MVHGVGPLRDLSKLPALGALQRKKNEYGWNGYLFGNRFIGCGVVHLYRLIFGFLLLFSGNSAFAVHPIGSPDSAALTALFNNIAAVDKQCIPPYTEERPQSLITYVACPSTANWSVPYIKSCPAGSLPAGQPIYACTCPEGKIDNDTANTCDTPPPPCPPPGTIVNGVCVKPEVNNCPKNGVSAGNWNGPGTVGPKSVCVVAGSGVGTGSGDTDKPGCLIKGTASFAAGGYIPGGGGDQNGFAWGAAMSSTGEKCVPGTGDGSKPDTPKTCVPPKVAGFVNGEIVCYTPSAGAGPPTVSQKSGTSTTSKQDGSTTKSETTATTTCAAGTCTTTTTITNINTSSSGVASAPVVSSTTSTCTQGPGCSSTAPTPRTVVTNTTSTGSASSGSTGGTAGNPGDTSSTSTTVGESGSGSGSRGNGDGSGDDSSFSGTCQAGYSCSGDAIMCAMAQEQHKRDCKFFDDVSSAEQQAALAAMQKSGDRTGELPNSSTVDISGSMFDSTDALGGGSCIQDMSVTVWGHAQTIQFSKVCSQLGLLGNVLLVVSFLLAARIVSRG